LCLALGFPAVNCWAIVNRPLGGLSELLFVQEHAAEPGLFGSECRRLHTPAVTAAVASMAPAPIAVAVAVVATFHLVIVAALHTIIILAPVHPAIVVLSAHCHSSNGKNHQKSEHYGSF